MNLKHYVKWHICSNSQPYMNDMAPRVPVVCPHIHVQQGLFMEMSSKCCQCIFKTPRLLWNKRENNHHLNVVVQL